MTSKTECKECDKPRSVGLVDGRQVCSYCDAWRNECEARQLLTMPLDARRHQLKQIEEKRGKEATNPLRETMMALWQKKDRLNEPA